MIFRKWDLQFILNFINVGTWWYGITVLYVVEDWVVGKYTYKRKAIKLRWQEANHWLCRKVGKQIIKAVLLETRSCDIKIYFTYFYYILHIIFIMFYINYSPIKFVIHSYIYKKKKTKTNYKIFVTIEILGLESTALNVRLALESNDACQGMSNSLVWYFIILFLYECFSNGLNWDGNMKKKHWTIGNHSSLIERNIMVSFVSQISI